jgi:hypothetical protein
MEHGRRIVLKRVSRLKFPRSGQWSFARSLIGDAQFARETGSVAPFPVIASATQKSLSIGKQKTHWRMSIK